MKRTASPAGHALSRQPTPPPATKGLEALLKNVPGWLSFPEAEALRELAGRWPGHGRIVELGSYQGRSTICLAVGLRERGDTRAILAVDPHRGSSEHHPGGAFFDPALWDDRHQRVDTFPAFQRHLSERNLSAVVEPFVGSSIDAARHFSGAVRMLFVDASHDEQAVREDIEAWGPYLEPGALIVLHDYGQWEGPTRIGNALLAKDLVRIRWVDSLLALCRDSSMRPLLETFWVSTLEDRPGCRLAWQREGGHWTWDPQGVSVEGRGEEWAGLALPGLDLRAAENLLIEVDVCGEAAAAGLSFGPYKDFLAAVSPEASNHLQLELETRSRYWAFRIDGQHVAPTWWNSHVNDVSDLTRGLLTLKGSRMKSVRFENLRVHRLESACRVTVIMVCNRFHQRLRAALRNWCLQPVPSGTLEVIVVNPQSPDGTHEYLAAMARSFPEVRLRELQVDRKLGMNKGAMLNEALEHVHGEWIWFTDADCIFSPECLNHVLEQLHPHENQLYFGERRHLSGDQTAAVLAGRLDPMRDFGELLESARARPADTAPYGYTQIVPRSLLQKVRYSQDFNHFARSDDQFVHDCRGLGYPPSQLPGLICLHLDHPFSWNGTRAFL